MLDKDVFFEQMTRLKIVYQNWKIDLKDKQVMSVWYDYFKDIGEAKFKKGIDEHIMNERFSPSIASLTEYMRRKQKLNIVQIERSEDE